MLSSPDERYIIAGLDGWRMVVLRVMAHVAELTFAMPGRGDRGPRN